MTADDDNTTPETAETAHPTDAANGPVVDMVHLQDQSCSWSKRSSDDRQSPVKRHKTRVGDTGTSAVDRELTQQNDSAGEVMECSPVKRRKTNTGDTGTSAAELMQQNDSAGEVVECSMVSDGGGQSAESSSTANREDRSLLNTCTGMYRYTWLLRKV